MTVHRDFLSLIQRFHLEQLVWVCLVPSISIHLIFYLLFHRDVCLGLFSLCRFDIYLELSFLLLISYFFLSEDRRLSLFLLCFQLAFQYRLQMEYQRLWAHQKVSRRLSFDHAPFELILFWRVYLIYLIALSNHDVTLTLIFTFPLS